MTSDRVGEERGGGERTWTIAFCKHLKEPMVNPGMTCADCEVVEVAPVQSEGRLDVTDEMVEAGWLAAQLETTTRAEARTILEAALAAHHTGGKD